MCIICLDFKRGALTKQEALGHMYEIYNVGTLEELEHLDEVREVLNEEQTPETD